jgi:hypothetical protein
MLSKISPFYLFTNNLPAYPAFAINLQHDIDLKLGA